MNLLDLCEDLFLYVCELNRMGRGNMGPEMGEIRGKLEERLADMKQRVATNPKVSNQLARIEKPLVFFADSMIATSKLKCAVQWRQTQNRLAAKKFNELAGDERFFENLEQELKDPSDEARERLAVYYTCLGLGFTGGGVRDDAEIQQYMHQIFSRIQHLMDKNFSARLCEDAYKSVDRRVLTEPPSRRVVFMLAGFAFLGLCVLLVYYGSYLNASEELRRHLDFIEAKGTTK